MARFEERIWPGDPTGQSRADREPFRFRAYVPDPIADADFPLQGPVARAVAVAEAALLTLNHDADAVASLEPVARQLLRAESVASSRIEGLEMSHARLARADHEADTARDETARSVIGNMRAMERAISLGETAAPFATEDLLKLHLTLLTGTRDEHFAGQVRAKQNWLGGSTYSPRGAEFIPPPPEYVEELLDDLAAFVSREDLPAVQQAAIAHAQFETIHPFADGNGRVGRSLIHTVLRRRQLALRCVPPISLVLATDADRYVAGLGAYRAERESEWTLFFADTASTACREAAGFAEAVTRLQDEWRARVGRLRRDSAASRLIDELPRMPIVDVATVQERFDVSDEAARLAIRRLAESGILRKAPSAGRARAWEAVELFTALDGFERDLATLAGEQAPSRASPHMR